jgi:hypothetical protein
MASNAYLLGPNLHRRIVDTIAAVEGDPYESVPHRIPTDLSSDTYIPKTLRVGTFHGKWDIGTQNTVAFKNVTAVPNTVSVTNMFYNLPDMGGRDCIIAKEGTAWYLVQDVHTQVTVITGVTLTTAGLQFTKTLVTVVATATAGFTTVATTAC